MEGASEAEGSEIASKVAEEVKKAGSELDPSAGQDLTATSRKMAESVENGAAETLGGENFGATEKTEKARAAAAAATAADADATAKAAASEKARLDYAKKAKAAAAGINPETRKLEAEAEEKAKAASAATDPETKKKLLAEAATAKQVAEKAKAETKKKLEAEADAAKDVAEKAKAESVAAEADAEAKAEAAKAMATPSIDSEAADLAFKALGNLPGTKALAAADAAAAAAAAIAGQIRNGQLVNVTGNGTASGLATIGGAMAAAGDEAVAAAAAAVGGAAGVAGVAVRALDSGVVGGLGADGSVPGGFLELESAAATATARAPAPAPAPPPPLLLVLAGGERYRDERASSNGVSNDVWLFDVASRKWEQLQPSDRLDGLGGSWQVMIPPPPRPLVDVTPQHPCSSQLCAPSLARGRPSSTLSRARGTRSRPSTRSPLSRR